MIQILDFNGYYKSQTFYKGIPTTWVHLRELEGVNGYCDEEAKKEIMAKTAPYMQRCINQHKLPVSWIGSGNYHYNACLLVEQLKHPFSLVVFDHHPDMQPSFFSELLSCGCWVLHALKLPCLKEVVLLGVREELLQSLSETLQINPLETSNPWLYQYEYNGKQIYGIKEGFFTPDHFSMKQLERWLKNWLSEPVYISIDKDVLLEQECPTTWDGGSMSLEQMLTICRHLKENYSLAGVDVCGEGDAEETLSRNQSCNQALSELFCRFIERSCYD